MLYLLGLVTDAFDSALNLDHLYLKKYFSASSINKGSSLIAELNIHHLKRLLNTYFLSIGPEEISKST
jgi:hypothetical protein